MKGVRPIIRLSFLIASLLSLWPLATAQQLRREKIIVALEKDGCVTLEQSKVKICKYDYSSEGNTVEAISFRPLDKGPFPGLLLIPGYQGSATVYLPLAIVLARQGFASLSVAQPGFGKSQGKHPRNRLLCQTLITRAVQWQRALITVLTGAIDYSLRRPRSSDADALLRSDRDEKICDGKIQDT